LSLANCRNQWAAIATRHGSCDMWFHERPSWRTRSFAVPAAIAPGRRPPKYPDTLRSIAMKMTVTIWRALVPTLAAVAVLVTLGCSQDTTRKDVAGARDKLQKEQQQTSDTIRQGQQDVADAQQRAQEHIANKPVTTDQTATPDKYQEKVADTRQNAA